MLWLGEVVKGGNMQRKELKSKDRNGRRGREDRGGDEAGETEKGSGESKASSKKVETCSRREWWLHQALYRKVKKEKCFKAVGLCTICWLVGLIVSMLPKSSQAFAGRKQRSAEEATWGASTGFIELYQDQHCRVKRNLCCRFHASKIQSCDMSSVKVAWNPQGITPAELKPQNCSGLTN